MNPAAARVHPSGWTPNTEGVFYGLPAKTYHDAPGVSHSMLRAMDPTPAHLRAYLDEEFEPTPLMILGTLTHDLILEPERPLPRLAIKPSDMKFSTKEGKAWRSEQQAAGRLIIGEEAHTSLLGMVRSVSRHARARELLSACDVEVSVFSAYADGDETTLRKGRMDIVPHGNVLADVKTCDDASPDAFAKKLFEGYATQAAYYLDLWNDANPQDQREGFVFIAVERRPPYCVATYIVHPDAIAWGRTENRRKLGQYILCEITGEWPGYPTEFVPLNLPAWATRRMAV